MITDPKSETKTKVIVVGGGPAGMMASIRAAACGAEVHLIEKNDSLGRKLLLTGKGRCNLTNACPLEDFLARFSSNGAFLRDAFKKFFYPELMQFFEQRGLKLKVERQERVFPESDRATDILRVLQEELRKLKVHLHGQNEAKEILAEKGVVKGIRLKDGNHLFAGKVILATGGVSYIRTGSTGDGLRFAEALGHSVVPLRAGLVPLIVRGDIPKALEGLTLKNIRLTFFAGKKNPSTGVGELLFTGEGISGPLVLTLSGKIVDRLREGQKVTVEIDLKPGLTPQMLGDRLLRDFTASPKKVLQNILKGLLPLRLIETALKSAGLEASKPANQITQKEREKLVSLLKAFRLEISESAPLENAMVTQGGVSLKEINPRTMESRLVKGLHFAGEMIDLDADTGGFNLQCAFSTGYLAGENAAGD